MEEEVPEDVRAFLSRYIDSYDQLEILLLLRRERSDWTAEDLRSRVKVSLSQIEAALAALCSHGLVQAVSPEKSHYIAVSRPDALDETISRLAGIYASRPIEIIRLMSTNAIERVRTSALRAFVDAFVLRKDGRDG
jgi:hypothetical protein